MQRCNSFLVPAVRSFRRVTTQFQPSRSFIYRNSKLPTLWNVASEVEQQFKDMRRHFEQWEREMNSHWEHRKDFILPVVSGRVTPMTMYESVAEGKYQMQIVLGERFLPEDIKVTLKDRVLTVEAKYDHTSEDGKSRVNQQFMRQFTLPDKVDPAEVKSSFTPEGVLQIEAAIPVEEAVKPKEIPIKFDSSK